MRRICSLVAVGFLLVAFSLAPTLGASAAPESPAMVAAGALFTARRDAEAQAAFERIVAADPANHVALYHLGRLAKRRGDWKTVAQRYERCTELSPESALYWADLGEAYGKLAPKAGIFQQLGLARRCRAALEKAVALAPEEIEYREGLIEFYEKAPGIAGGGRDKALAQAAEITRREPYAGALATGGIQARAKQTAAAEEAFRAAARLRPAAAEPRMALGSLYVDAGRFDEAFTEFDALRTRDSANFDALFHFGRVAALSGKRLAEGESALRRYLDRPARTAGQPSDAHAHLRLGEIHLHRGDRNSARASFEAALRLEPGLKAATEALAKLGS